MAKIPVYFMPGLAASSTIFEYITLPEDQQVIQGLALFHPTSVTSISHFKFKFDTLLQKPDLPSK